MKKLLIGFLVFNFTLPVFADCKADFAQILKLTFTMGEGFGTGNTIKKLSAKTGVDATAEVNEVQNQINELDKQLDVIGSKFQNECIK